MVKHILKSIPQILNRNMKILVFDTETTGLPEKFSNWKQVEKYPHLIQLSYILYDTDKYEILKRSDLYVNQLKNEKFNLTEEATKIHGITHDKLINDGKSIEETLHDFEDILKKTDVLVAHNLDFDMNIIACEYWRTFNKSIFEIENCVPDLENRFCTMYHGRKITKILRTNQKTGNKYYKMPKLTELYESLFRRKVKQEYLHDSNYDTYLCLKSFLKMNDFNWRRVPEYKKE